MKSTKPATLCFLVALGVLSLPGTAPADEPKPAPTAATEILGTITGFVSDDLPEDSYVYIEEVVGDLTAHTIRIDAVGTKLATTMNGKLVVVSGTLEDDELVVASFKEALMVTGLLKAAGDDSGTLTAIRIELAKPHAVLGKQPALALNAVAKKAAAAYVNKAVYLWGVITRPATKGPKEAAAPILTAYVVEAVPAPEDDEDQTPTPDDDDENEDDDE